MTRQDSNWSSTNQRPHQVLLLASVLTAVAAWSGCSSNQPAGTTQPAQEPPTSRSRTENPAPAYGSDNRARQALPIGVKGRVLLQLETAFVRDGETPRPCTIVPISASQSQPAAESAGRAQFQIVDDDKRLIAQGEITSDAAGDETTVTLSSSRPLPPIQLVAHAVGDWLPVSLTPRDTHRMLRAAIGPIEGDYFDGLFDAQRDEAIRLGGQVYCQQVQGGVRLTLSLPHRADSQTRVSLLSIRLEKDYLRRTRRLSGYVPAPKDDSQPMPAVWMPLDELGVTGGPDEIARNLVWMAVNLKPYGAASVLTREASARPLASQPASEPHPGPGPRLWVTSSTGAAWQQFMQSSARVASRFWGQGLIVQGTSETLLVGPPLSRDQARLFASLIGLSGQSPIMGERMYELPEERVELLRRVIPAAPVRAVDLFAAERLPPIWNLVVGTPYAQWNIIGLFNLTDVARPETVELEDLCLGSGAERFAVYDLWDNRLLRVVNDRFVLRVPPMSARVVCVRQLHEDAPTLLCTGRHLTGGAIDLHQVRWDPQAMTLSGFSDLVAYDPYELRIYIPEGHDSFEVDQVRTIAASTRARTHGPMRIITLESDVTRRVDWTISFTRSEQPTPGKPPVPRQIAAVQNTRGVRLSWIRPDAQVVSHRIYRNDRLLAEVEDCEYQDSTAVYGTTYRYVVAAVDPAGRESPLSSPVIHRTPVPASTNLTQLVPLTVTQDRLTPQSDRSVTGSPMRVNNQRLYRGIGTLAPSRVVYFLGGGYDVFTGAVGIDDAAEGRGSAIFRIVADGQTLFTSTVVRGGQPAIPFATNVRGKLQLELIVTDTDDGNEADYADWGNAYLRAAAGSAVAPSTQPNR